MARNASLRSQAPTPPIPTLPPSTHRGWRRFLDALLAPEMGPGAPEPARLDPYVVTLTAPDGRLVSQTRVEAEGPGHALDLVRAETAVCSTVRYLRPASGVLHVRDTAGRLVVTLGWRVALERWAVDAAGRLVPVCADTGDVITGNDPGDENDCGPRGEVEG